jgi:DNA-binding MarR family transcriptional regulator
MSKQKRTEIVVAISHEARASQNQTDLLDEAAAEILGINRTDHRCMDILDRHARLTAGELAEASGLTTGAVTSVLDRLERAGYARRVRDTVDRRRVLVQLTPKARRLAGRIYGPLAQAHAKQFDRYTTEQLALILEFIRDGHEVGASQLARVKAMRKTRARSRTDA